MTIDVKNDDEQLLMTDMTVEYNSNNNNKTTVLLFS